MARNACQVLACRRGIVIFPHGNRRRYLGTAALIGALRTNTGLTEPTANNRTGRVARSLEDGKLCRYILFDHKTAQAVEDRISRCDEGTPKPKRQMPAAFSWGR